jgi:hypothetical protein
MAPMSGPTTDGTDEEFGDEHTPLPSVPGAVHDPEFPTGRIPRIRLDELGGTDDPDRTSLYPRWRAVSACADAEELTELYAPHFEGTNLWLFPSGAPPLHPRVALDIVTRDRERALAGIVEVIERTDKGPYERPAIRVKFLSIDRSSAPCVLGMTAGGSALRELLEQSAHREVPAVREDRTVRMSKLELSDLMGVSLDELHGWDERLACAMSEVVDGAEAHPAPIELVARVDLAPGARRPRWWIALALVSIAMFLGLAILLLLTR